MQECYEFADGTSFKISTHEMLLPSKERIEGKGISLDYMCKTNKLKCCLSIIDIEKQFGIEYEFDTKVKTINDLVDYVNIKNVIMNLSVSTYVEAEDTREKIDIIKLNAEIEEIVAREQVLRDEIAKIIAEIEV